MPTYEYKCENCNHEFELFQSITAKPVRKCPECGKNKAAEGDKGKSKSSDSKKEGKKDSKSESKEPKAEKKSSSDTKSKDKKKSA